MFFFGNRKITAVLAAFIFLGLFGWFWRHRESVPFVSQPLSLAAAPFEYGTSRLAEGIHTGVDIIDGSLTRWQENENLKTENGTLKAEQAQYNELLAENTRLRSMLGFKAGYRRGKALQRVDVALGVDSIRPNCQEILDNCKGD